MLEVEDKENKTQRNKIFNLPTVLIGVLGEMFKLCWAILFGWGANWFTGLDEFWSWSDGTILHFRYLKRVAQKNWAESVEWVIQYDMYIVSVRGRDCRFLWREIRESQNRTGGRKDEGRWSDIVCNYSPIIKYYVSHTK